MLKSVKFKHFVNRRHCGSISGLLLLSGFGYVSVYLYLYLNLDAFHGTLGRGIRTPTKSNGDGFSQILPGTFAYSAFIDNRFRNRTVRIVTIVNELNLKKGWCHFWPPNAVPRRFNTNVRSSAYSDKPKISRRIAYFATVAWGNLSTPVEFYETCESHEKRINAYYLSCQVPNSLNSTPSTVIISRLPNMVNLEEFVEIPITGNMNTQEKDSATSGLKNTEAKQDNISIGVCVPPLFGKISVDYMIEFVELTRILGADHFIFYDYDVSDSLRQLLLYYQKSGVVTFLPWGLPVDPDLVWYYGQSAAIADCLFRTTGRYDWVLFNDLDEYFVPQKQFTQNGTLREFLKAYEFKDPNYFHLFATLKFSSTVFHKTSSHLTDVKAKQFVTMAADKRTMSVSDTLSKQMVRPEKVFELGIHHLSRPIDYQYVDELVDERYGLLYHYRQCVDGYFILCHENTGDQTMHKYLPDLIRRTTYILDQYNSEMFSQGYRR